MERNSIVSCVFSVEPEVESSTSEGSSCSECVANQQTLPNTNTHPHSQNIHKTTYVRAERSNVPVGDKYYITGPFTQIIYPPLHSRDNIGLEEKDPDDKQGQEDGNYIITVQFIKILCQYM